MTHDAHEFASIVGLDDASIRALLAGTDPRARLHAAWALGLRRSDARPQERGEGAARRLIASEPHPGVRRHLAVMLGGDIAALDALVELDPSERVRETAMRLLVQSWPSGDRAGLGEQLARVLETDASEDVRLAAMELVVDWGDSIEFERVAVHLAATDTRLRDATVDALLGHPRSDIAPRSIADASFSWPRQARHAAWARLVPAHRDALVASARARGLAVDGWLELTRAAFDDEELEHSEISWLAAYGAPLEGEALRISRRDSIPQHILVSCAETSAHSRALFLLGHRGHAGERIEPHLAARLDALRRMVAVWDDEYDGYDCDWYDDQLWLTDALARLAGEVR